MIKCIKNIPDQFDNIIEKQIENRRTVSLRVDDKQSYQYENMTDGLP